MRRLRWLVVIALVAASCDGAGSASTTTSAPSSTAADSTSTSAAVSTTRAQGTGSTTTTLDPGMPTRGGSVVVGLPFVPTGLNELDDDGFAAARWIRNLVRPAAYVMQPDGGRLTHLVVEDPSFDDGGLFIADDGSLEVTWTIDVRARWSDGERVTAGDFALFHEAECGDDGGASFEGEFLDADPGQVRVRFPTPTPHYREAVAHVMPVHAIDPRAVCFDDAVTWPSTGPFIIDSVSGSAIELVRNPAYWRSDPDTGARLPYLDGLTIRTAGDLSELLSSESVDVASGIDFLGADAPDPPAGVVLEVAPGQVWEFLTFQFGPDNRNEDSLNTHLAYRQALIHALDREALAAEAGWLATDGLGGASPHQAWRPYDHDPEEAAALLEDLCIELERDCETDPPRLVFTTTADSPERVAVAGLVEEMWTDLGVTVELQLEDSSLFFNDSAPNGTYDIGMWAWVVEPDAMSRIDILGVFDPRDPGPEGRNWYRWGSAGSGMRGEPAVESFEAVLDRAATAVEAGEIAAVLQEAEQLLADEVVVIPVAARPVAVVHRADVQGPAPAATSLGLLWNAEFWFVSSNSS